MRKDRPPLGAAVYHVFDIAFTFNPAFLVYGIVGGGLGVTAFGLIATRPVLNSAPIETLRRV